MDTLALEGMKFHAYHGYYAQEKKSGGEYIVDIYLHLDLKKAGLSDDLSDTLNYEEIYSLTNEIMQESKNLIEHIAYEILDKIALKYHELDSAKIRVSKLKPPMEGEVEKTFVELERDLKNVRPSGGYWEERAKY